MTRPGHSSRRLDLRTPIGRTHSLRLVEAPDDPERILADLREVADLCVPTGRLRYGVLSGDPERLSRAVLTVVYRRDTGRPVGFNAMSWLPLEGDDGPIRVLHAGLCMVVPGERRGGLLGVLAALPALAAFVRNGFSPLWVTNVTQVPAVAGLFAASAGSVFPAPGRRAVPGPGHTRIARAIMSHHRSAFGVGDDAEFDPDRFIIRNAYTGGSDDLKKSWLEAAKHRDPAVNDLCRLLLDYERGDDLLQVGRLSGPVVAALAASLVRRMLTRQVRRLGQRGTLPWTVPCERATGGLR